MLQTQRPLDRKIRGRARACFCACHGTQVIAPVEVGLLRSGVACNPQVQWIDVNEYKGTRPDAIVMDHPHQTLQVIS